MSHLKPNPDGSISLVADRRLFSRTMVKQAALTTLEQCHALLDLDGEGNVVLTLRSIDDDPEVLRVVAGQVGNLLVSELVRRKMDAQSLASRNLLVARALDGALPRPAGGAGAEGEEETGTPDRGEGDDYEA